MATKITNDDGLLTMTNAQVLDTVRKYAPQDYQRNIPPTTQGGVEATLKALNNYMPCWDVFWNVFLGRIGRVQINDRMNFTNPLAKLKKPSLRYGRMIQEIQTNLIKARAYDAKDINVFGREGREPDIHQAFHQENRRDKYELNIPMEDVLHGSFIEGESISAFFNALTETPIASANNDEYVLMRKLLSYYDEFHGFYNIHVEDMHNLDMSLNEQLMRGVKLVQAMSATYTKLKYFRTEYSPEGRNKGLATRSNRVIAIIDADVKAALDAANVSFAFKGEKQKIVADEIIVLDELPIPGCQALMLDDEWFQCSDTITPMMLQSPLNPSNMSYNYFYHVWQVLSYSIFLNAVMFSTRPDSVLTALKATYTGITLKDSAGATSSTISAGEEIALVATVEGENMPNQAVMYEIKAYDGAGAIQTLPAMCFVDSRGVFHSGNAEATSKFVISATSVASPDLSALYTVTIEGSTYVTEIAGADVTVKVGENAASAITWTPTGATSKKYDAMMLDTEVATVAVCTDDAVTVTGIAAGTTTLVIMARGGDPAKTKVVAKVNVTVTE